MIDAKASKLRCQDKAKTLTLKYGILGVIAFQNEGFITRKGFGRILKALDRGVMTPHHHSHAKPGRPLHKDLLLWIAVVLMLAALVIYVLTLDDSLLSRVVATSSC
jgi:hypothetical protein